VKDRAALGNASDEVRTVSGTEDSLNITEGKALAPNKVSILAVSPFSDDVAFLQDKFEEANLKLCVARTIQGALIQLRRVRVSIVICERQLPDGNWKDVLRHLAPLVDRPNLIVVSRQIDVRLWSEVLNQGAFDLLATPFREAELAFVIGSAWLNWTGEQERRLRQSGKQRPLVAAGDQS
jgi:DNA-binding NtrC family response regulator